MGLLDKARELFGGAAKTTRGVGEKAGEAEKDSFEKVEEVAESTIGRIRDEEGSSGEVTPGGPPA